MSFVRNYLLVHPSMILTQPTSLWQRLTQKCNRAIFGVVWKISPLVGRAYR